MLLVLSLACDTFSQLALVRSATRPTDRTRNQSGDETELTFSRVRLGCRKNSTLVFCVLPGQAIKVNVEWNVCLIRWIYFSCHLSTWGFSPGSPSALSCCDSPVEWTEEFVLLCGLFVQEVCRSNSLWDPISQVFSVTNVSYDLPGNKTHLHPKHHERNMRWWWVESTNWTSYMEGRECEWQGAARDGQNPPSSGAFWELTGCVHCLSPVRKWKSNVIVWHSVLFYWLFIIILLVFSLCLKKTHIVSTKYLRTEEKKWFCL